MNLPEGPLGYPRAGRPPLNHAGAGGGGGQLRRRPSRARLHRRAVRWLYRLIGLTGIGIGVGLLWSAGQIDPAAAILGGVVLTASMLVECWALGRR
jgi:hypothetical protein